MKIFAALVLAAALDQQEIDECIADVSTSLLKWQSVAADERLTWWWAEAMTAMISGYEQALHECQDTGAVQNDPAPLLSAAASRAVVVIRTIKGTDEADEFGRHIFAVICALAVINVDLSECLGQEPPVDPGDPPGGDPGGPGDPPPVANTSWEVTPSGYTDLATGKTISSGNRS
jgi:hypothetical protein